VRSIGTLREFVSKILLALESVRDAHRLAERNAVAITQVGAITFSSIFVCLCVCVCLCGCVCACAHDRG
jgi:hypothetical protein